MAAPVEIQKLAKGYPPQSKAANIQVNGLSNGQTNSLDILAPFPAPTVTGITADMATKQDDANGGFVPDGMNSSFMPAKAAATFWSSLETAKASNGRKVNDNKQSVIFDNDDRTPFVPTGYPWSTIGKVRTAGGWGTGTIIGPRHVLTASHCVNWNSDGSAGWITFTPGYFDGRGPQGEIGVNNIYSWEKAPHFLTDLQVAFDYVVLITNTRIGDSVGYAGTRTYNSSWNGKAFWQYLGYPQERTGGERPYIQNNAIISTKEDHTLNGNNGSALGNFNDFTPGQSGGPCWGFWAKEAFPRVVGVGSIIGSTVVQHPGSTASDNDYGGGEALDKIVAYARQNSP